MTSPDSTQKKISIEIKQLSLKIQELLEKRKIQCLFLELKNRCEFRQTEDAASHQHVIDSIDDQLRQLAAKKAELQNRQDNILSANNEKHKKEVSCPPSPKTVRAVPAPEQNEVYVEAPPTFPAPAVILDLDKLPLYPCKTRCPECQQFIMTETFTTVSSLTWLACFMLAMIGCAAGCCLIPFCIDTFKSTTHRCPQCGTLIRTITKL